jgi:hypothetical protein
MSLEATKVAWKIKLKSSQKLVILSLADRADSNNFCFPSISRLTEDTCLNRKTVLEAVRVLEELGHITIEKGLGKVNKYILNLDKPVPKTQPVPELIPVPKTVLPPVPNTVLPSTKNGTPTSPKNGTLTYQDNLSTNLSVESTPENDLDLSFAKLMFSMILDVAPKSRQPNYKSWTNTIRLMRERDGFSPEEITDVFKWANSDEFWKTNILSPEKLRAQFAKLHAQMMKPRKSTNRAQQVEEINKQAGEDWLNENRG